MRPVHGSDPENDCATSDVPYELLPSDEKVQVDWVPLGINVNGAEVAGVVGIGSASAECTCEVKMEPEAGVVDENGASSNSGSKRSLLHLMVLST
jgi:hypothetical protein